MTSSSESGPDLKDDMIDYHGKLNEGLKDSEVGIHRPQDDEMLGAIETIDIALQTVEDIDYVVDDETKFITTVIINKEER